MPVFSSAVACAECVLSPQADSGYMVGFEFSLILKDPS